MKLRHGIYTHYQGHELKVMETREDVPIPDYERNFFLWCEDTQKCPFADFTKDSHGGGYYKIVPVHEIPKVFYVQTYGKYKNHRVVLFSFDTHQLTANTRSRSVAEELQMIKTGENWYGKQVPKEEIEIIWEELIRLEGKKDVIQEMAELMSIRAQKNASERKQ